MRIVYDYALAGYLSFAAPPPDTKFFNFTMKSPDSPNQVIAGTNDVFLDVNTLYEYEDGATFNFTLTNPLFVFSGTCTNIAVPCSVTAVGCTPLELVSAYDCSIGSNGAVLSFNYKVPITFDSSGKGKGFRI